MNLTNFDQYTFIIESRNYNGTYTNYDYSLWSVIKTFNGRDNKTVVDLWTSGIGWYDQGSNI